MCSYSILLCEQGFWQGGGEHRAAELLSFKELFIPTHKSSFTQNSLVSVTEYTRRKSVKKRGVLDCVVLSGE